MSLCFIVSLTSSLIVSLSLCFIVSSTSSSIICLGAQIPTRVGFPLNCARFSASQLCTTKVFRVISVSDGRSSAPQYHGLRNAISTIFREEGLRGLYKGVTPNVWGSGSAWGFYFLFYNSIKTWVQGGNSKTPLGPTMHMMLAAQAGILTLIMTNPVWVVDNLATFMNPHYRLSSHYHRRINFYKFRFEGLRLKLNCGLS
ncbi:unnamed protein product [Nesidiocoris tenuis]|uniref:Mitochondrial folate transporter/carrier n=1 Tax=Nesidiocoris tenuis TaxID=355587 RepID=A0A6H5G2L8_9HEMI|nr:unnamed protein product [Nesidiocoris tenuis]